jgi:drug/metabolite transporter (DMT)-like permease
LGNNTPIVVGLLSWVIFRKRPAGAFWLGSLLAFAGTLVILWADLSKHVRFGVGDLTVLGAATCFAVYLTVTERVRVSTSTLGCLRLAMISTPWRYL